MPQDKPLSPETIEAVQLLGNKIALARRERRWTLTELAERTGVSPVTASKVEKGDPSVAVGTVFETATLLGVPLFHHDPVRRSLEGEIIQSRLALLPETVRSRRVNDDF